MNIIGIIILSLLGVGIIVAIYWFVMVKIKGVETDGVISRIEEYESSSSDAPAMVKEYYVKFKIQDGKSVESKLSNPTRPSDLLKFGSSLAVGDRIRIKYLPGKEVFVVMVGNG